MHRLLLPLALALPPVLACADSGGDGEDGSGAAASGGAGGSVGNAGNGGSGASGSGGAGGGPSCDIDGLAATYAYASTSNFATIYRSLTHAAPPAYDFLAIQLWHDLGADTEPHMFTFTGENYSTCNHCAILSQGCTDEDPDIEFATCEKNFLVVQGLLDVTQNASNFTGSLTGARAIEVTVDWEGTAVSTPVEGGEEWCLEDHSFDVAF